LAGVIPGILLVGMTALWGIRVSPRTNGKVSRRFEWAEARASLWEAKWELLLPVVAFVGLFSGLATPVEAAALTALYAFVVETFIYRDLRLKRDATRVMTECGLLVGGVLLILGVALGFTNYLVDAQVPVKAVEWVTAHVDSKWTFLLLLNLFLIVVGALMDIYSAIVIVVPLIVPLGAAYGIDPLHLGIVFLANAELGFLMPPVGENLFLSSSRFGKPVGEVFRAVLPMVVVFLICVALITYIPALTTTLPRWFVR
jgi:tripartite ATP-independent transporter DctM subunit